MDPLLKWRFLQTFSYAVEALMLETRHLGWSPAELAWPRAIRSGVKQKLNGHCRILQDRFALVYSDFFRDTSGNANQFFQLRSEFIKLIFTEWKDWSLTAAE